MAKLFARPSKAQAATGSPDTAEATTPATANLSLVRDPDPVGQMSGRRPLGEILIDAEAVTADDLERALEEQRSSGLRVGEQLVKMGVLDEPSLTSAIAAQHGLAVADLGHNAPDQEMSQLLGERRARQLICLPMREVDGVVEVVAGEVRRGLDVELAEIFGAPVRILLAPPAAVREAIDRTYTALAGVSSMVSAFSKTSAQSTSGSSDRDEAVTADSPVARVVTMILTEALRERASDIHLEPSNDEMRVRLRIDGALNDVLTLPMAMSSAIVSRIKILAGMNIVERRKAQDGQFGANVEGRDIDIRVSTMATVWGEKCVMRILDKSRSLIRLSELGMPGDTHQDFSKMVRSPFGMVLCAGPTGSGKTTTLYATLSEIDERSRNIVTIEDPVEYVFPSFNQVQTNDQAGITFADGLRSILRQDPDVILVGEIRDQDTARIAVQAALTGHFVMSSLHATDSVAALHRFLDMGIEAFLLSSSVLGIVSQRLVRRICRACMEPHPLTEEEMAFYAESGGPDKDVFFRGTGCNLCSQTGYRDRIGVYEFLHMTPEIRRLLVGWATQDELRRVAIKQGMRPLRTEGISLVAQDMTTVSEVIRSIYAL